jgi:protein-tyrosine kinase
MSIVEEAAKRLEQLRRAGVEVPWAAAGASEDVVNALRSGTAGASLRVVDGASGHATRGAGEARDRSHVQGGAKSRSVHIDLERLSRLGFVVPDHDRTLLAEQMRVLKRPLLANMLADVANKHPRTNLIIVTSALEGEGKTFFSLNLALSLAMEVDYSVLLVDADMVRPGVLARCGLPEERGLMDVLTNPKLALSDVMLRTNVPKLSLLPAGTSSAKSTELLASSAMDRLLEELASRYPDRIVIFDAPPLLSTSESRVLAGRVGQVVMVVEAERTPQSKVAQAFSAVEQCPIVMSVLNKTPSPSGAKVYGYRGD